MPKKISNQQDPKSLPKLSLDGQRKRLYNHLSAEVAQQKLLAETFKRKTISFYLYFHIQDPQAFRDGFFLSCNELAVLGRIYLAHEGINAQISVPEHNLELFRSFLDSTPELTGVRLNFAAEDDGKSFAILKVKIRDKIVADGISDPGFDMSHRGKYLNAAEFNQITRTKQAILVDMRNHYEFEVGHFDSAIEVPSDTFREQLPMAVEMLKDQQDKNIIMYCTGGIRCEKASAWMLHNGFKNVYHLEGGIIKYANDVKEQGLENKFLGKNFVFDQRFSEKIGDEVIAHCHQCGELADRHNNCANIACHLLFIQCAACKSKFEACCSAECQEIIHLSEEQQNILRQNQKSGSKIFKRQRLALAPGTHDVFDE